MDSTDPSVPARVGGVDLSLEKHVNNPLLLVPARVGGVDLSWLLSGVKILIWVPARVGGVDLSVRVCYGADEAIKSPPVWAGWI